MKKKKTAKGVKIHKFLNRACKSQDQDQDIKSEKFCAVARRCDRDFKKLWLVHKVTLKKKCKKVKTLKT